MPMAPELPSLRILAPKLHFPGCSVPSVVWKNYKRPHAGQPLTRKYHTAAVMAAARVGRVRASGGVGGASVCVCMY